MLLNMAVVKLNLLLVDNWLSRCRIDLLLWRKRMCIVLSLLSLVYNMLPRVCDVLGDSFDA